MINGIATEAVVDTATPRLTHSPTDDPHYSISTVVDPELPGHSPSSLLNPVGSHNSSEPTPSTVYPHSVPNSCSNFHPNSSSHPNSDSCSNSYPNSDLFRNSNPHLNSYSITCSNSGSIPNWYSNSYLYLYQTRASDLHKKHLIPYPNI